MKGFHGFLKGTSRVPDLLVTCVICAWEYMSSHHLYFFFCNPWDTHFSSVILMQGAHFYFNSFEVIAILCRVSVGL